MSEFAEEAVRFKEEVEGPVSVREQAANLLGGSGVLRHSTATALDAHDLVQRGIPAGALDHLLDSLVVLEREQLLDGALGMSLRTLQRLKDTPMKPLSREQSDRAWKFAEVFARAIEVFGSREEAEGWLERPSIALEQRRPIELLATAAGTALVETTIERIDYGVYT